MSRLGIDRGSGMVYEGKEGPIHPVWPTPLVSQATLILNPNDFDKIPNGFDIDPFGWIFVESSYDPISRVRRGRLFQKFGNNGWELVRVEAHPAINSDLLIAANNGSKVDKNLSVFLECSELLRQPNKGEGLQLAIGQRDSSSVWRILQIERLVSADILLTLRAESAFGILPEINKSKIHTESLASVESAYLRVMNAAYRELPTSVVDQCRNAAVVFISRWVQFETNAQLPIEQDLGVWIKHIKLSERVALRSTLEVINRLHPRGKDNEAIKLGLRTTNDQDAEFAVHAIGFIIRELGWAL